MNYEIGQTLKLERNSVYADNANGARLQETSRKISNIVYRGEDRIGIQFKGSKVWFQTYSNSEWLTSATTKYRII